MPATLQTGRPLRLAILAASLLPLGCQSSKDRPPLGRVSGSVTYDGNPLTSGSVSFVPMDADADHRGHTAIGILDGQGAFTLTTFDTGDGATLGRHKVIVEAVADADQAALQNEDGMMPSFAGPNAYVPPKPAVPLRYTKLDTTPLIFTVEEGRNTFEIELTD